MSKAKKNVYETPELVSFGNVRDITLGQGDLSGDDYLGSSET